MTHMNIYYFTFGSDSRYPFGREDYVAIAAEDESKACDLFQARHPNRPESNCLNCASVYTEDEFNEFRDKYYKDRYPIEAITVWCRDDAEKK